MKNNEESLHELWGNLIRDNLHLIRISEEKEKEAENLFKWMIAEKFLNLGRDLDTAVHKLKVILIFQPKMIFSNATL